MIDRRFRLFFTGFMGLFMVLATVDIVLDTHAFEAFDAHVLLETLMLLAAFVSVLYLWLGFRQRLRQSGESLRRVEQELQAFRERHDETMQGMRRAMHDQFSRWNFSETEARLANFLIRGYSLKQIAAMQDKSERTVRNQSVSVYEKSGMTGRHDLAAFFLADLFPEDSDSAEH